MKQAMEPFTVILHKPIVNIFIILTLTNIVKSFKYNNVFISLSGLLAFAMESQDIAAVFREENSTLVIFYQIFFFSEA